MTGDAQKSPRRWPLALKAGILTTLIGPLAGALCVAGALVVGMIFSKVSGGYGTGPDDNAAMTVSGVMADTAQSALGLVYLSYLFGIVPAAAAGASVAAYFIRTGRPPGRNVLLIGALMPLACLLAVGAFDSPLSDDPDGFKSDVKIAGAAVLLGIGAAMITARVIQRLLRRSLAQFRA